MFYTSHSRILSVNAHENGKQNPTTSTKLSDFGSACSVLSASNITAGCSQAACLGKTSLVVEMGAAKCVSKLKPPLPSDKTTSKNNFYSQSCVG